MDTRLTQIINEWDPIGLFPAAPKDEYEVEIRDIADYLKSGENITVQILAEGIYKIFSASFEGVFCEDIAHCKEVAGKILSQCILNR